MSMYNSPQQTQNAMLLCRECGVLYPIPAEQPEPDSEAVVDLETFRTDHREHTLERAFRLSEPVLHDRPAWDPMARSWFRVSVGESAFFVCSSRTSIDEPRRHEICHRPPSFLLRGEVDETMLRRALDRHFFPNRLETEKLNSFIAEVRSRFAAVDAADVETSYDDPELANAAIGPCPNPVAQDLRKIASHTFGNAWERQQLLDFIDANTDEYGALAIRVLRELRTAA